MARLSMHATAALVLLALAPGCKNDKTKAGPVTTTPAEDEDTTFAEDGTDSNAADTDAQLVASSLVASSPGTLGLASFDATSLATEDVGDGVKAVYLPRACASGVKTSETEAKYTFHKCIGPNGLSGLSGTVLARFTSDATTLRLELTYTELEVNDAKIDGSATAAITADGANRSMTWTATLDGTTARGKPFSYRSDHTVAWKLGETCFALEGTTDGQVGTRDIKTSIENFSRCGRGCPDAGGKITVTNVLKNKVVSIAFNGTARATYTAPNGKESVLPLLCKP